MKIIATDLDRTLIPNGNHSGDEGAMNVFDKLLKKNKVSLIYVTGRTEYLIKNAMKKYKLPKPSYCISMVGTRIYKVEKGKLKIMNDYKEYLSSGGDFDFDKVKKVLLLKGLRLQPKKYLNENKISYYLKSEECVGRVKKILRRNRIRANVIYSFDANRKIHILDVLHPKSSKLHALEFLLKKMGIKKSDLIYCGDSGNDLEVMKSGIKSVLVKNAIDEVKRRVRGCKNVYVARGGPGGLNGNYVSGIIEGVSHFGFFER
jgi:sucrose-6-phosphatase